MWGPSVGLVTHLAEDSPQNRGLRRFRRRSRALPVKFCPGFRIQLMVAPSGPLPLHLNSALPTHPSSRGCHRSGERGGEVRRHSHPARPPSVGAWGLSESFVPHHSSCIRRIGALYCHWVARIADRSALSPWIRCGRFPSGLPVHPRQLSEWKRSAWGSRAGEALSSRSVGAPLISHRSCDPVAEPCCIVDGRLRVTNPGEAFFRCYAMISSSRRFSAWRV